MTDLCRLYHTKVTQRTPSSTTITRSVRPADVVPFLLLHNQLTRAFVFRLSPHSVHTHFTRVHPLCIKSSSLKNFQELVHQSPATNPLALDSTCNKGSESMQTLSSSVCAACTIPKKFARRIIPHKTCFELWHWNSHHSKLFTDPTKVWSTFEPVMIFASKVCWFCPDVARWARPSFTKKPAHTHTHKNPSCPHTGF